MSRFTLRTNLLWSVPYFVACLVIFTALREPMFGVGEGIPIWHWLRFVVWGVVTVVWLTLFLEDRRAFRRAERDRASEAD